MKASSVINEFRRRAEDTVQPYLWSNDEALLYLNEANRDWVRGTGGIRDSQSDLCELVVDAGATFVELDKRILKIVSARRTSDDRDIDIVGPRSDYARCKPTTGTVTMLVQGEDDTGVRPINIPTESVTLQMVIDRLPLNTLTPSSDLEVRDEHAYKLVDGMLALAYTKQDTETRDDKKAQSFAERFVGGIKEAYLEKRRRMGSNRTVAYGGI